MLTPALPSRRAFLATATTLAAATLLPRGTFAAAAAKPNSVFNGVRIGAITYSYRSMFTSAEETLGGILQCGLSEIELMGGPIQQFAGIAVAPAGAKRKAAPVPPAEKPTEATRAAQLAKCRELRKLYNDAGVTIHLHKIPFGATDEEIDFNFEVAKALGCVGITTERSDAMAKKLAPFATKHKVWVAFHNHTANLPAMGARDPILELSPYIGFNLDIGHYVAGSKGLSPIPVLEKYHDRILSLHLKDRTADGGNVPWGQGQTPIKDVLQLMRKERWKFPADIELEYKIPDGSDAVTEVTKCVQFCKAALA
jgi:sugar phosphate isomerase/epimerase